MRKTDMIRYYVPVRRLGDTTIEEQKGYCVYYVDPSTDDVYHFMIRKVGKGWQVDQYETGYVIGRSYPTYREACATVLWMIKYKDLIKTLDVTLAHVWDRDGKFLNEDVPSKYCSGAVQIYLPEERSENNAAGIT